MPVISVANLDDLVEFLNVDQSLSAFLGPLNRYRDQYGIATGA
jgi:hypothetical protein